ncbi:WD-40 repeat protein [Reticulomyxa filosa]|uniref:WD-40 repeat protein n=1 Tax=Reticulomyxa filosa TaxID=46433 RepID=X6MZU2_RETFI|nr:WD-40 repeat protein [Reticulomyxa filosa]|eukprot:ETO18585.1 WD-40 repeat protein [Reticulomyxa filosa]
MSKADDEKLTKELEIEVISSSFERSCFSKDWLLQLNQQGQMNHFICLICKQVARNPIEITCTQHKESKESLIVGENCLKKFLTTNPNSCPVQPHDGCVYSQNRVAKLFIDDLQVTCPLQFEHDSQTSNQEGEESEKMMCNFKGQMKDLYNHLEDSCPLKSVDCWYKLFGCDYHCNKQKLQEHLISKLKFHFDLVVKFVHSLKQTIQLYQNEITQLKVQIKTNEKKEENESLINENSSLKKEIIQIMELKQKELLEKDNEIQKMERDSQQELLKLRADIEIIKRDFNEKENKQLSHYDQLIKLLQEKNERLIQDVQKLSNKDEQKENDNILSSKYKHSSNYTFDIYNSGLFKIFSGHSDAVYSLQYSSLDGGRFLCSASHDYTVRVWDLDTNEQIQIFNGHSSGVVNAKFSPYHRIHHHHPTICSASHDNTIRFWDIKTAKEYQIFKEHSSPVCSIQFSPFTDGMYLCSGSVDHTIRLWNIETSKSLHIFNGHTSGVRCVEFSPLQSNSKDTNKIGMIGGNGYTICSGSFDKTIRLWDIENTKQLIVFNGHEGTVRTVKYSRNETNIVGGNVIYSGSDDKTIRLWDIRTGKQIHVFKGHTNDVWAVEYLPVGSATNIICSGSIDNTIRFWDTRTSKQLHEVKGFGDNNGIYSFEFVPLDQNTKNSEKTKNSTNNHDYALCYGSGNGIVHFLGWTAPFLSSTETVQKIILTRSIYFVNDDQIATTEKKQQQVQSENNNKDILVALISKNIELGEKQM